MRTPSHTISGLADRLLALEAADGPGSDAEHIEGVLRKLCDALTPLVGSEGVIAILRQSLARARAGEATLVDVRIDANGGLDGLACPGQGNANGPARAIISSFLYLLVTFLSERIVLDIVCETWPELEINRETEAPSRVSEA